VSLLPASLESGPTFRSGIEREGVPQHTPHARMRGLASVSAASSGLSDETNRESAD